MKKIAVVLFLFLNQAQAGEVEDAAAKAFAEQAGKAFAQQLITKQLDKVAADILKNSSSAAVEQSLSQSGQVAGEQAGNSAGSASGGLVSKGFAIYGIYRSADKYLEAETQSQKYYASVQVAAAIVSYINPAIGAAVSLIGVGQQMLGDLAMKGRSKRLLKTYEEIMEMQKKIVENLKQGVAADTALLVGLNNAHVTLMTKVTQYQVYISENCHDFSGAVDDKIFMCAEASIQSFYTLKNAMVMLERMLQFQTTYVGMEAFLKASDSQRTVEDYKNDLNQMILLLNGKQEQLNNMIQSLSSSLATAFVDSAMFLRKASQVSVCSNQILTALNRITKIDFQIIKAGKDADRLGYLLTTRATSNLESSLLMGSCAQEDDGNETAWNRVASLRNLLQQAQNKSYENYLKDLFR